MHRGGSGKGAVIVYLHTHKKNLKVFVIKMQTRPAWAGFKTAEEGRTKIMLIYT